jgi:phospholipase C
VCCTAHWDHSFATPRHYTLGAGHHLTDVVHAPRFTQRALTVYGPNGFLRQLRGNGRAALEVTSAGSSTGELRLRLRNQGRESLDVTVRDESYGGGERRLTIEAGTSETLPWSLHGSHHWYDLTVTAGRHAWRLAGHLENGRASITDPANTAPILT